MAAMVPPRFGAAHALCAAVLMVACTPSFAGWFSKGLPVPQWGLDAAKTPTPDYAKDASAIILYDEYVETIDAQGHAVEREREAIRILQPQGRGNSCAVSYDVDEKINYFRVWTMAADAKTYQAQDTDFTEAGNTDVPIMLSTRKARVAHPPAVDVGAVEICESEELMEPYSQEKIWDIQNGIPIVFEALEIDLPPGLAHAQSWHNHPQLAPVEVSPNHWRWEIQDMPALILRGSWRDSFDITLPPGYAVEDTPDPTDIDVDFASYHSTVTAKANQLHYEREYVVRQVEIPPTKAADFRKLESAILADERNSAVLKKQ